MKWEGVIPAITTPFTEDGKVDTTFLAEHAKWMIDNGCTAIVALGSLGEGATLEDVEKELVLTTLKEAVGHLVPIVSAVSSLSTAGAIKIVRLAEKAGCDGLMVLPPYAYSTDWREMKAHISAIFASTELSCILYNNPIAYKTDYLPEHIMELAHEHKNFHGVKESSTDTRRIMAINEINDTDLTIGVGVDDCLVEGVAMGAEFWIAGLVNAFSLESVKLYEYAKNGEVQKAKELYKWFLPLLRLDTVPKFIQLVKFVQEEVGKGSARVRGPRLELSAEEAEETRQVIKTALENKPVL